VDSQLEARKVRTISHSTTYCICCKHVLRGYSRRVFHSIEILSESQIKTYFTTFYYQLLNLETQKYLPPKFTYALNDLVHYFGLSDDCMDCSICNSKPHLSNITHAPSYNIKLTNKIKIENREPSNRKLKLEALHESVPLSRQSNKSNSSRYKIFRRSLIDFDQKSIHPDSSSQSPKDHKRLSSLENEMYVN
jgi:hypothetical protein